jgi:hypothetical protein
MIKVYCQARLKQWQQLLPNAIVIGLLLCAPPKLTQLQQRKKRLILLKKFGPEVILDLPGVFGVGAVSHRSTYYSTRSVCIIPLEYRVLY